MMKHIKINRLSQALMAALLTAGLSAPALAASDVDALKAQLAQMQEQMQQQMQQMQQMQAKIESLSAQEPKQQQQVQRIEQRVARVESAPVVTAPAINGNRVFFRGGYAGMTDDRGNGVFTDILGVAPKNNDDSGWYFGAGFDFLLSNNTFGLLPGTWAVAELGLEFRDMGSQTTPLAVPTAACIALNNAGLAGGGAASCLGLAGNQELMMFTVSAAPKLKFMEGSKLRPWIIPAGLDINVVSPPTDSSNYLDVGVQFGAGVDYEVIPGITVGADARYHLSADLSSPDYSAAAVAAAAANGLTLNTNPNLDTWTAGLSLGIEF